MELLIGRQAGRVWAGTFHHIGNRLPRRAGRLGDYSSFFTLVSDDDRLGFVRLAMTAAWGSGTRRALARGALPHIFFYGAPRIASSSPGPPRGGPRLVPRFITN